MRKVLRAKACSRLRMLGYYEANHGTRKGKSHASVPVAPFSVQSVSPEWKLLHNRRKGEGARVTGELFPNLSMGLLVTEK